MSKSILSGLSLRSGAILFSLVTALGASAAADPVKPSQYAWGYPIGAAPSEPKTHRAATVAQQTLSTSPSRAGWGYPIGAAPSEPQTHRAPMVAQPGPSQAAWGYRIGAPSSEPTTPKTHTAVKVSQPAPRVSAQTSR